MARWQLTEAHYLNVPDNKWEQQITDRSTGRPIRKQFLVPLHLDPNIESDWNHQERIGNNIVDGKIVVCHAGKGEPKDITFSGPPTPGMLPLDDEARELSSKLSVPFTTGLDPVAQANGWQQQLLVELSDMKQAVATAPVIPGFAEFMKAMTEVMSTQTTLLARLAPPKSPDDPVEDYDPAKHVPDDEAPLEDPEPPTQEELAASIRAVRPLSKSIPPVRRI
jgi:hypothetical protein